MKYKVIEKIMLWCSALFFIITMVTGITILGVSSQKQLNQLSQFPSQLQKIVEDTLQDNNTKKQPQIYESCFYKIFLMSLVPNYLVNSNSTPSLTSAGFTIGSKLWLYTHYLVDNVSFSNDDINVQKTGAVIWDKIKLDIKSNYLTFNSSNGFMFLAKAFFHGESIKLLFHASRQRTENVQTLLHQVLENSNQHDTYVSLKFINDYATNFGWPHAPDTITVATSFLEEIKDGIILLIIISPIFIGIFMFTIIGFELYTQYNRKTKLQ